MKVEILFGGLSAVFLIYVFLNESSQMKKTRKKLAYLSDLDGFLGNLKHQYYFRGSVRDALYFAVLQAETDLKEKAGEILEIAESQDFREKSTAYMNSNKDKYMRLLMSMVILVEENGDGMTEGISVFINSLMQMRMDIKDEIRRYNSRKHKFMGLSLTCSLPVASVPFVAAWGVSINPSLLMFYYGRIGSIVRTMILMIGFLCYTGVMRLRDPEERETKPLFSKLAGIKDLLLFALSGMIMLIALLLSHIQAKELLQNDTGNIENVSNLADGRQLDAMKRTIPYLTIEYTAIGKIPEKNELIGRLLSEDGIRTEEVASDTADEIIRRVTAYGEEKFDLLDLISVLAVAVIVFLYPRIEMLFGKVLKSEAVKDEIMQFQSIICMLKDVPGISLPMILESLESFAKCFKKEIRNCIDDFGINELEALEHLRETNENAEFKRLADCFIAADELGVKASFDEIVEETKAFREDRRAEKLIMLDNDVLLASLLAIIPGGVILFGYLLAPFMISALNMFNRYQNSLKDHISIT